MPAARQALRSSSMAAAVTAAMTGWRLGGSMLRMRRGLDAIHFGHMHVHQDQIVCLARECIYRFPAIGCNVGIIPQLLQHALHDLLVDQVIFRQQDAHGMRVCHVAVKRIGIGRWPCIASDVPDSTRSSVSRSARSRTGLLTVHPKSVCG